MKKYLLITKTCLGIKYDIFYDYDDLMHRVQLVHEHNYNAITKWYRVDNITFDKLDFIVDTFAKFVHSINMEIN